MSSYCVLFSGEIHEDFQLDDVKSNFKSHLSLSEEQVKLFFSGNEIIVNSDLSQNEALGLIVELEEIGGICYFLHISDVISLRNRLIDNRRKQERRKRSRRASYRGGIFSDRRHGGNRRKAE